MYLVFSSLIQIGDIKLTFLNEVETRSTWKEMTATATIRIPKRITVNATPIKDVIKTGQRVVIRLGYDGKLQTHFVGYVAHAPKPGVPLEITCEDEMWKLKRLRVEQKVFANAKLSDLIEYIAPGYEYDVLDTQLGANYSCLGESIGTAAAALKKIETVFGLKSFFRLVPDSTSADGVRTVLIVGRPYSSNDLQGLPPVVYKLRANTRNDSLQYRFASDNPIQIKGIVKVADGKDLSFAYPPDLIDSSVQTRHYFGISQAELEAHVKADYLKANVDRYEGDINGFGIPFVRHGQAANIIDDYYEKRDVTYFIDVVTTRAGITSGLEIVSTIGYVVSDLTRATFK